MYGYTYFRVLFCCVVGRLILRIDRRGSPLFLFPHFGSALMVRVLVNAYIDIYFKALLQAATNRLPRSLEGM